MLKTLLFDFDKVLCRDKFYEKTLIPNYQELFDWIQNDIFSNSNLINNWMRGKLSYLDINKEISDKTGFDLEKLNNIFLESVRLMEIDKNLIGAIIKLKDKGYRVAIVTDNMDIFSRVTISNYKLDDIFEIIVNSANEGLLKKDDNGKLFDIALERLKIDDISEVALIDDSKRNIDLFKSKGGVGFLYEGFDSFNEEILKSFV